MKREVSQGQLEIAAELEEIARRIRQGKWEMASFASAEEGVDPAQCFASILRGAPDEDEEPEEVMRENLEFLSGFSMYTFFLNKHADPAASRTSITRWNARNPEAKPDKRLSPSQGRLAQILGLNAEETLSFMRQTFRLLPKGARLGEMTRAAQSLREGGDDKPTPQKVAAFLRDEVPLTPGQEIGKPEKKASKERSHVSVWEIRN